jgi:hypothetical protein
MYEVMIKNGGIETKVDGSHAVSFMRRIEQVTKISQIESITITHVADEPVRRKKILHERLIDELEIEHIPEHSYSLSFILRKGTETVVKSQRGGLREDIVKALIEAVRSVQSQGCISRNRLPVNAKPLFVIQLKKSSIRLDIFTHGTNILGIVSQPQKLDAFFTLFDLAFPVRQA